MLHSQHNMWVNATPGPHTGKILLVHTAIHNQRKGPKSTEERLCGQGPQVTARAALATATALAWGGWPPPRHTHEPHEGLRSAFLLASTWQTQAGTGFG